jgi:hypothetical protein
MIWLNSVLKLHSFTDEVQSRHSVPTAAISCSIYIFFFQTAKMLLMQKHDDPKQELLCEWRSEAHATAQTHGSYGLIHGFWGWNSINNLIIGLVMTHVCPTEILKLNHRTPTGTKPVTLIIWKMVGGYFKNTGVDGTTWVYIWHNRSKKRASCVPKLKVGIAKELGNQHSCTTKCEPLKQNHGSHAFHLSQTRCCRHGPCGSIIV